MATAIRVRLQADELSRLEEDRQVLAARVLPEPALLQRPEAFRIDLVKARRRRDRLVGSQVLTFPAGEVGPGQVARFDLAALTDADGFSAVRRGRYFVRVTALDTPGLVGETPDLPVRLVTAHRLAKDYLHGLARLPADVLGPRHPPRRVLGVEVLEVAQSTAPGFHVLSLHVDASGRRALQWAGGRIVSVDAEPGRYLLPDARDGFLEVAIGEPEQLPAESVEEPLLIERTPLDLAVLGRFIDRASDWLECTVLQLYLEPTLIATTDHAGADLDYDVLTPPLTLYVQPAGQWLGVRFPFAHVTQVLSLSGQIAGSPVLDLPRSWIQLQERIGFAQLVPSHQAAAWRLFDLGAGALQGAVEWPSFWRFVIRAGLREVPGDLVEAIAKRAALDALTVIGQAYKPGIGSESFSKELSVSASYVRTAQANLLSASRAEYAADLERLVPQLKSKYLGLANMTIV